MAETNPTSTNRDQILSGVESRSKSAEQALLSIERAQKLDLLKHLITNLQQSLVVCGPEGIGKTTLLENLVAGKSDSWIVYSIKGTVQLSFEQAQADLLQYLQQNEHAFVGQNLEQILSTAEKNNQKIVVLIDDAGFLAPGLIGSLCQFASAFSALRVIFALTADELHVKNSSDKAIDGCHFIDVPALSEQQCGDFLKNLASKPGAIISADNLNSAMIGKLYQETHGIPGKIVNMQKGQVKVPPLSNWQWISAAAALLIAVIVGFFLWGDDPDESNTQQQRIEESLVKQQVDGGMEKAVPYPSIIEDSEITLPDSPEVVTVEIETLDFTNPGDLDDTLSEGIDSVTTEFNKSAGEASLDLKNLQLGSAEEQEKTESSISVDEYRDDVVPPAEVKSDKESQKTLIEETEIEKTVFVDSKVQDKATTTVAEALGDHKEINTSPTTLKENKDIKEINAGGEREREDQKPIAKQAQIEIPKTSVPVVKQQTVQPTKKEPINQTAKKTIVESSEGTSWVLDQKASHYTLQLMAISKQRKPALLKAIKKHSQLREKLHYFEIIKKGEKKYVLLYGSFTTPAEAKQATQKLPKEFAKPWLRSFKVLHKQINANRR
jgi:DamX protein